MADNILKGSIKIEAPGVEQTVRAVNTSVSKIAGSLKTLNPELVKAEKQMGATKNAGFAFNQILREAPAFAFSFQTGIVGISNNLPILTDALKKAKESGAGTGEIIKSLANNLFSLPSILSLGSLALTVFGGSLFGASNNAEKAKASMEQLNETLDRQKNSVDALSSSYRFLNDISKLNIQINFKKGGEILGLQGEIFSAGEQIFAIKGRLNELSALDDEKFRQFQAGTLKEKDYNEQIKAINETRKELWKRQTELEQEQVKNRTLIRLQEKKDREQEIEDQKAAAEKARANFEKYARDQIALAKRIYDGYKNVINLKLDILPEDELSTQLNKANDFLSRFNSGKGLVVDISPTLNEQDFIKAYNLLIKNFSSGARAVTNFGFFGDIKVPPEEVKPVATAFGDMFGKELSNYFNQPGQKFDFSINVAVANLDKEKAKLRALAGVVSDTLTPVFQSFFNTIAQGGNAFKALAQAAVQALTGLISKLITTAILAAIIGPLLGAGTAVGASSSKFADVFKFLSGFGGARAAGGPVEAGKSYLVGENGPEIVQFGQSGTVIPNHRLGGGSFSGGGMAGKVVFEISGNKLRGILKRADISALGLE